MQFCHHTQRGLGVCQSAVSPSARVEGVIYQPGLGVLLENFLGTPFPPIDLRTQKIHLTSHLLLLLSGLLTLFHGQLRPEPDGQGRTNSPIKRLWAQVRAPPTPTRVKIALGNTAFTFFIHHLMAFQPPGSYLLPTEHPCHHLCHVVPRGPLAQPAQILEGLGFILTEVSESDIHRAFQPLLHRLNLPGDRLERHTGSTLFLSQELPLPRFLNVTMAFSRSRLFGTDFLNFVGTTHLTNDHFKEETQGKIVDSVSELCTDIVVSDSIRGMSIRGKGVLRGIRPHMLREGMGK